MRPEGYAARIAASRASAPPCGTPRYPRIRVNAPPDRRAPGTLASLDPASQQQLRQAVMLQRSGRLDEAQAAYRSILQRHPGQPDTLSFLAALHYGKREYAQAAELLQQLLAADPERQGANYTYALVLSDMGRNVEAIEPLRRALIELPDDLDLHLRLARALAAGLELEEAAEVLERARARWPDDVDLLNNLGIFHTSQMQTEEARRHFQRALELAPDSPVTLTNYGKLLVRTGEQEEAERCFHRVVELDPDHVPAMVALARAAHRDGDLERERELLKRALEIDPDDVEAYVTLGRMNFSTYHYEHARGAFERAMEIAPEDAMVRAAYGRILFDIGETDEGIDHLERSVAINPRYSTGWVGLVHGYEFLNRIDEAQHALEKAEATGHADLTLPVARAKLRYREKRYQETADELSRILTDVPLPEDLERNYRFELAKHLDKLGDAAAAFRELEVANAMVAAAAPEGLRVEDNMFYRHAADMAAALTPEWVGGWSELSPVEDEEGWPTPVFLCGFPRSGTTLLDQILDAHPGITVVDERPTLQKISDGLERMGPHPDQIGDLTDEQAAELRAAYYDEMRKFAEPGRTPVIVDKMPLATASIPKLVRVLPGVRFILAIRHPADACLSCFMQEFALNRSMANFVAMPSTVATYRAVMDIWIRSRELLDLDFVRVRYEDLIQDLEGAARPVIEFLGLEWDDAILDHTRHARERGRINTPSYRQVSQPIYKDARYRWERYREQLAEHLPALAPYATYFDYDDPTVTAADAAGEP